MIPAARNTLTLVVFIAITGCEDGPTADALPSSPPEASAVVDLRIGVISGADPYMFGSISGIAIDTAGRILVADRQAEEIRVFSPDGEFIYAFGGSGAGPGEVTGPCCLAFGPDGDFWVRDGGNARYNRYELSDSAAAFVSLTRMSHGDVNFGAPTTFDSQGRLIDIGHSSDPSTGAMRMVRYHVDSLGTVAGRDLVHSPPDDSIGVHEVPFETANGPGTRYLYQPFGPGQLIAHSPDGSWAEGISSRYAINWHLPDGSTQVIHRPGVTTGPALSSEERDAAEERINFYIEQFGVARMALPFGVPDTKPPLRALHFDNLGRLWVEVNVPDDQPHKAEVFDRTGSHVGTVRWPDNVSIRAIYPERSVAVGVAVDSMEVQRAVRLRLPLETAGNTEDAND